MTGNINSRKSALHVSNEPDFPGTETGCRPTAPAEILQFRHPHNANDAVHGSPLNDDRDLALMNLIKAGNFDTKQSLITRNLCLVLKSAKRYANKGASIFDLLKAGNLGLEHALENFRPEDGECFSTYTARCIREKIEHALLSRNSCDPAVPGKSGHDRYRIGGNANPPPVRLIRDSYLLTHGQID